MEVDNQIPITIGTYAKCILSADKPDEIPSYAWTCFVYVKGHPFCDLSVIFDKVEFTLHKSFPNHIRRLTEAPFFVSAEGWGEFPIIIDIFVRNGPSFKTSHYLKLNAPGPIVVNETSDVLLIKPCGVRVGDGLSDVRVKPSIPVFSELTGCSDRVTLIEDSFIDSNATLLERLVRSEEELVLKAFEKEIEYLTTVSEIKRNTLVTNTVDLAH